MEGLGGDHHVDRRSAAGSPRRWRTATCGRRGACSSRIASICGVGVGRVHVVAEGDQHARSACRCRRRARGRCSGWSPSHPGGRLGGVRRTAAVVGLGDAAEGAGPALESRRSSRPRYPSAGRRRALTVCRSPTTRWPGVGVVEGVRLGVRRRPRRDRRRCCATAGCDVPRPRRPPSRCCAARTPVAVLEGSASILDGGARGRGDEIAATRCGSRPSCWRWRRCFGRSPLQALARLHTLAAAGSVDRRRGSGGRGTPASAERLQGVARLLDGPSTAPALLLAAVVHAELRDGGAVRLAQRDGRPGRRAAGAGQPRGRREVARRARGRRTSPCGRRTSRTCAATATAARPASTRGCSTRPRRTPRRRGEPADPGGGVKGGSALRCCPRRAGGTRSS